MKEPEINYKRVYQKLAERYPNIAVELVKEEPKMDSLEMLKVYTLFCQMKGIYHLNLPHDSEKSNLRSVFVAVVVSLYDPDFFIGKKRTLRRGLRRKMAALLNCHDTQISHILASVRTYLKAYKHFRTEVGYIYSEIKNHLDNENKNNVQKSERHLAISQ